MRSARLVAESLRVVPVPVAHELPSPQLVAAVPPVDSWCAAWQPDRCAEAPPTWLRPAQHDPWRRAVAAIEGWSAAVLAEPVGSGKSWIALAVAHHLGTRTLVIGPAALATQWRHTARQVGIGVEWHSHERLSRGGVPDGDPDFVIVDEAHRFRHLDTRRARTLAPWIAGRRSLMLTATPIINRRSDLVALLRLLVGDTALTLDGVASLRTLEEMPEPPAALARLVIRSTSNGDGVPVRHSSLRNDAAECARGRAAAAAVGAMSLGDDAGVRSLVATVLLDAAASSDAAWRAAMRRYRALLLQSRDAGGLSRAALRHFAGPALDQLVLWPLLEQGDTHGAPPLGDLPLVEATLDASVTSETWMLRIRDVLADERPTICFTRHRATAIALVRHLGDHTAWVTGAAAGIGPHRLARDQVLSAFGPDRDAWALLRRRPSCLVCTEVLAEGLNLQGANRVIHLDLPWHASRLEQRTGRVRRIGQLAPDVEVIARRPAPALERILGQQRRIRHKARLAQRWLEALTIAPPQRIVSSTGSWCSVAPATSNIEAVAWLQLQGGGRHGTIAAELQDGTWHQAFVARPSSIPGYHPNRVTRFERGRIKRLMRRAVWFALDIARPAPVIRPRLVARVLSLARLARQQRNHAHLEQLDRLLTIASRSAPIGLEQRLARLAEAPDAELVNAALPQPLDDGRPLVTGLVLVLFRPEETQLR